MVKSASALLENLNLVLSTYTTWFTTALSLYLEGSDTTGFHRHLHSRAIPDKHRIKMIKMSL